MTSAKIRCVKALILILQSFSKELIVNSSVSLRRILKAVRSKMEHFLVTFLDIQTWFASRIRYFL